MDSQAVTESRLVRSPVFILSAPRSGSTLLRRVLGAHSAVHATTELVLTEIGVEFLCFPARLGMHTFPTEAAFGAVGLDRRELAYLLWDRILHRELTNSGKAVLVHKAPRVLLRWQRLVECWPEARFIFLLRHPAHVVASGAAGAPHHGINEVIDYCLRLMHLLQDARERLVGLTVRYEELTAEPTATCQMICDFIGVRWEPEMLDYGRDNDGQRMPGTGDMSDNLRSGRIQPSRPLPALDEVPRILRPMSAQLGYAERTVPNIARAHLHAE